MEQRSFAFIPSALLHSQVNFRSVRKTSHRVFPGKGTGWCDRVIKGPSREAPHRPFFLTSYSSASSLNVSVYVTFRKTTMAWNVKFHDVIPDVGQNPNVWRSLIINTCAFEITVSNLRMIRVCDVTNLNGTLSEPDKAPVLRLWVRVLFYRTLDL